jgi:PIN domain nuclease of toxin-antitoxin system
VNVLLDTHVVLWWFGDEQRLSREAARVIERADEVLISPISCWEIGLLQRNGRIVLDRPMAAWIHALLAQPQTRVADLSPHAAGWAGSLGAASFPGDPADRMLFATARDLGVPFITKDERLRGFAAGQREVPVIW